ncbi:hypothetical protein H0H92_006204 [Tricholoma furcatifolium]|nr:hypothetical protein H0H92_006204 [Tricholoma furcatifolium]
MVEVRNMASFYADAEKRPPLDKPLVLSAEELDFFKDQTQIQDEDALKRHIIDIFGYQCIRYFGFVK